MKFAVQKWVRTKEMRITEIKEYPAHPEYLRNYCAGCHAALAGQPWAGAWAVSANSDNGEPVKLCKKCTEEAKEEMASQP